MNKDKLENFDVDSMDFVLKSNESQTLDRKQKITSKKKIAKTIAAMANTEGGKILIGISDDKKIIGIDPEEEIYMMESANELHCQPKAEISFQKIAFIDSDPSPYESPDKIFLIATVSKAPHPGISWTDGKSESKYFIRKNDQTISIV